MSHYDEALAFGRELISTKDLDPVYCALAGAQLPRPLLYRVVLAYWCFYHLGVAAWIADGGAAWFWDRMNDAAENEGLRFPRGRERRHFRGLLLAVESVRDLRQKADIHGGTAQLIQYWGRGADGAQPPPYFWVSARVQEAVGFGPWIAFKVGDMMERVLDMPVDFSQCDFGVYREPRQAAALILHGDPKAPLAPGELYRLMTEMAIDLSDCVAPPHLDRPVNFQEIETILCKYKSHVKGHYPVGIDSRELREALTDNWGPLSLRLRGYVP